MSLSESWTVIEDTVLKTPVAGCGLEKGDELKVCADGIWIENKGEWWCKSGIDTEKSGCQTVYKPNKDDPNPLKFDIAVNGGALECLSDGFMSPQVVWTAEENNGIDLGKHKKEKEKNKGEGMRA